MLVFSGELSIIYLIVLVITYYSFLKLLTLASSHIVPSAAASAPVMQ